MQRLLVVFLVSEISKWLKEQDGESDGRSVLFNVCHFSRVQAGALKKQKLQLN